MEIDSTDFDSKYTLNQSIRSQNSSDTPGLLEIYGDDLAIANNTDHKYLWTAIDNDKGKLTYIAGKHYINRIYYLVTNEPWSNPYESYQIEE